MVYFTPSKWWLSHSQWRLPWKQKQDYFFRSCPGHPLWSISPTGTLWSPSRALYIHISLQIQLWTLWNLKLKLLGSQLVGPTYPGHPLWSISPSGTHWSPSRALFILISLPNQLGSLLNLKLKLHGSQLVYPTYHGHPHCYISALWNPLELSRALYICISLPYQLRSLWNLKLKLLVSQLVDLTYYDHLNCFISALWNPLKPSWTL